MFDKLKHSNYLEYNRFAIVGIYISDTISYNILFIKKDKDKLITESYFSNKKKEDLSNVLKTNIPVLLHFSGRGIVSKKVTNNANFINEALFNANPDDFFIYTLYQENYNYVSVCRKEIVTDQIDVFVEKKIKPIDFALGPFVGVHLAKLLDQSNIQINDVEMVFRADSVLNDFSVSKDKCLEYRIGDDVFDCKSAGLLSVLLNFLYPLDTIEYDNSIVSGNYKQLKFNKIFNSLAIASLVFFLVTLLGSYGLLSFFNNKYIATERELYQFNDSYSKIKKVEEDVLNKEIIIKRIGITNSNFIAYFIHEIGNSVPQQISLANLNVNPLSKKIKNNEEVIIEGNTILIKGASSSSYYLNKWVKALKKFPWIKKIEILNVSTVNNKENFELKITVD